MSLKDRFEQLEERERKLLMIFGGIFALMFLVIVPLFIRMGVSEQATQNKQIREMIQTIEDERVTLGRKQSESTRVEARYRSQAPPLAGFLAKLADQVGVEIPETQDRSPVPRGKAFKERSSRINLKKVGLANLSNFMEKIVNSGYPIRITKLDIRKRDSKPDMYDVEMYVSAYDKEETKKPKKSASGDANEESEE